MQYCQNDHAVYVSVVNGHYKEKGIDTCRVNFFVEFPCYISETCSRKYLTEHKYLMKNLNDYSMKRIDCSNNTVLRYLFSRDEVTLASLLN